MNKTNEHILFKSLAQQAEKIKHEDAIQIFLWLYCTLSILPEWLPIEELSTEELIDVFTKLSRQNFIMPSFGSEPVINWADLPGEFLSGKFSLDEKFPERINFILSKPRDDQ